MLPISAHRLEFLQFGYPVKRFTMQLPHLINLLHSEMTAWGVRTMTDDNIIGIDGWQAAQLRAGQAEREKREEILRQKLKCLGFELQPEMVPGTYTIAHPHPPQPSYLNGWRDLSLEQVEDATSDIEIGQDPCFGSAH
jgi:hypothetical protein